MRHARINVILWMMLALLAFTGCAQTAADKVTQARAIYTTTLNSMADARAAGFIDDDEYRRLEQIRASAAVALITAQAAVDANGQAEARQSLQAFYDALARLEQAKWEAVK